jgi:hypothetical protein
MTPDESHAAKTPTNGHVARPGEALVTYKRLLPSFENLRRATPFLLPRLSDMLGGRKIELSRTGVEIRDGRRVGTSHRYFPDRVGFR